MNSTQQQFTYHMPTRIMVGPYIFKKIGAVAKALGTRVLLVTYKDFMTSLEETSSVVSLLGNAGLKIRIFEEIEPNPDIEIVARGARLAVKDNINLIIGLGGGSVIDAAKGISIVATHSSDIWAYVGTDKVPGPTVPIIAIPTTSGTGSEVTPFAVFSNRKIFKKEGVESRYIFPKVALIDPILTKSMPSRLTIDTGIDALAHAIEAYTSCLANPISDALATEAISLIARFFIKAVEEGNDLEAREGMALASAMAGMAITHAGVGAAHGFAMAIGSILGTPHGRTVGILLPSVMEYNAISSSEKFKHIVHLFKVNARENPFKNIQEAGKIVRILLSRVGFSTKLSDIGVEKDKLPQIVDDSMLYGDMSNNPRSFTKEEALSLLEAII